MLDLLLKYQKYFFSKYVLRDKVCLCGASIVVETSLFILRMICHINFKFGSINFRQYRKQQTK